jgi:hypothetical protein
MRKVCEHCLEEIEYFDNYRIFCTNLVLILATFVHHTKVAIDETKIF